MYLYSAKTNGFYPIAERGLYENSGTWPLDGVEITYEQRAALYGKQVVADINGYPIEYVIPVTLDGLKAAKIAETNSKAQTLADQLTAGYPDFERATWRDQQVEALAWNADNTKLTPYIDALALQRGIDRVTYLQKTVAKVQTYQDKAQKLVGQRQKYVDQITAIVVGPAPGYADEASAKAALDAIVINYVL